jgi:hypothetical protein
LLGDESPPVRLVGQVRLAILDDQSTYFEGMGAGVWGQRPQLGDERTEILCIVCTNIDFNDDAQTSRTHLRRGQTYVDFNDVCTKVVFSLGCTYVDFFTLGRTNIGFLALDHTYVDPNVGSH